MKIRSNTYALLKIRVTKLINKESKDEKIQKFHPCPWQPTIYT